MRRILVDAFDFVGLNGGSGGAGAYLLSLVEELSRLVDVSVLASPQNAHHFRGISERSRHLTVSIEGDNHAEAIQVATQEADLLYAPFTVLPGRAMDAGLPVIIAIHDLQHRFLKSFFPESERIERDDAYFGAASDASAILTFSEIERQNVIESYGVQSRIGVVPHAPFLVEDVLRDVKNTDINRDRNPFVRKFGRYILYPAVNWPHKNHYRLIEAFRFLSEDLGFNDVKLVLCGADCVETRQHFYKELLNKPWASQRVFSLGFISHVQLFMLMKGAEALVFPSLYEGFGIPVLEAMRLGTPVIASDLPVFREWFGDCYQPFRNIRDAWSMADDLRTFLTDVQEHNAIREKGLARSMEFSSRRTAEETFQFFSTVLDEYRPKKSYRLRTYRDVNAVKSRDYHLLIHVLVDTREIDLIARAAAFLKALIANEDCDISVVWICPNRLVGHNKPVKTTQQKTVKRSRSQQQKIQKPDGLGTAKVPLSVLANLGDIVYFDAIEPARDRGRATRFYTASQVDASFHCFITATQLAIFSDDPAEVFARHFAAVRLDRPDIDGFYVGISPWQHSREQALQVLHAAPERVDDVLSDPAVATHNFVLANPFVRNANHGETSSFDWFGRAMPAQLIANLRIIEPRPRFAYIETELRHRAGHHFGLVKAICDTATAAGLTSVVGANRDATGFEFKGLPVEPWFSSYEEAPEPHVTPTHFAEELQSFCEKYRLGCGDYVYLHMPYPTLIAGVLQVVVTSRMEDLPIFLIRICSTDESFRWHNIQETRLLKAIAALSDSRRGRIRVFVESVVLQQYFSGKTGLRLPVLLNPINRMLVASAVTGEDLRRIRRERGIVAIGYFGEARREKGFHLIPDIVERVLRRHGADRVQFHIQVSSNPANDTEEMRVTRRRLERLVQLYAADNTVTLYEAFPEMESYYNALAACDAILLPYLLAAYEVRGSGIAMESLALGVPIIVTKGTDMATTFAGPGCIVAGDGDVEQFADACDAVINSPAQPHLAVLEFVRSSTLLRNESEFMSTLIEGTTVPQAGGQSSERPIALWIGNEVLSQGCSAVYDAQRDFLRRHGFEVYNVYVPFPDIRGYLPADARLEREFVGKALGWDGSRYDFGCYSWMLNQSEDDARISILDHIAEYGGSTDLFLNLNSYNRCPPDLLRMVEARPIALVCLNYVHLLPVVEVLGLLGRRGTRVVLETHDIQAHQHAIRAGRDVDEFDKELELSLLSEVDAVVAISRSEYEEIGEHNPWANVEYVLPPMHIEESALRDWQPGSSRLNSAWLDLWYQRSDLRKTFDLRTPVSLEGYAKWVLIHGRHEHPEIEIGFELKTWANEPDPDFPVGADGREISRFLGWMWDERDDLRTAFPNAMDPNHVDRHGLHDWLMVFGAKECKLDAAGRLLDSGSDRRRLADIGPTLLEALILARPTQLAEKDYRVRVLGQLEQIKTIDVLIVASDHPANVTSVRQFIREVHGPYLAPHGVSLLIAGLCGMALVEPNDLLPGMIVLGEVETLESLYHITRVVAVPTTVGTGTPIKALDAFARGVCVSVSSFVDQALDLSSYGFPMAKDAYGFAEDIRKLLASEEARAERVALTHQFSTDHLRRYIYDAQWCKLAGLQPQQSIMRMDTGSSDHEEIESRSLYEEHPRIAADG